MVRPRFSTARLRARRSQRSPTVLGSLAGDIDSGWLELGGSEMRLCKDGGEVVWSTALPDLALALARYEFAAADLSSLEDDEDPDEVTLERS